MTSKTDGAVDGTKVTMKDARVTTSRTVSKVWNDNDNQDGARAASATVNLLANDTKVNSAVLSADNSWAATFSDLPTYTEAGGQITYTLTEESVPEYSSNVTENNGAFTVTNTHTPGATTYTATKSWNDDENAAGLRPASVEFTLVQTANGTSMDYSAKTVTAADGWTCTWDSLPTHVNGATATYSVRESSTDTNYTASTDKQTITNTLVKHDVNISKVSAANGAVELPVRN